MTICYFGNYNPEFSRNAVLIKGLQANGVNVTQCQTRERGLKKFVSLYKQHALLKNSYDVLVVGFSGYSVVWFAKLLTKKPIMFDAFTSLYLSDVIDRKKHSPHSPRAFYLKFLEKISYRLADTVLYDTHAHIEYVTQLYGLAKEKFVRVLVGANTEVFTANQNSKIVNPKSFMVHWHGNVVPFAGADIIVKAAKILKANPEIQFHIIAPTTKAGKALRSTVKGTNTITWYDKLSYADLAERMQLADVCLGVFGNNEKTQRVIPHKVFEAAALGKAVITSDQQALFELFSTRDVFVVNPKDPQALADAILELKRNTELRESLATNAYDVFVQQATPEILGKQITEEAKKLT